MPLQNGGIVWSPKMQPQNGGMVWCCKMPLQNGGIQNLCLSVCYSVTKHGTGSAVITDWVHAIFVFVLEGGGGEICRILKVRKFWMSSHNPMNNSIEKCFHKLLREKFHVMLRALEYKRMVVYVWIVTCCNVLEMPPQNGGSWHLGLYVCYSYSHKIWTGSTLITDQVWACQVSTLCVPCKINSSRNNWDTVVPFI